MQNFDLEVARAFNEWWKVLTALGIALWGGWRYLKRPLETRIKTLEERATDSTRRDALASHHDLDGLGGRVRAVEHEVARHEVMHDQKETELAELQRERKHTAQDIGEIRSDITTLKAENKLMSETLIRMDTKLGILIDRKPES